MSQIKNKLIDQMNQESAPFIPALSVRQPFAALIASGQKTLEIRTWETDYRGPLLICAGIECHSLYQQYSLAQEQLILANNSAPCYYTIPFELFKQAGCMVCLVDLVGIRPFQEEDEIQACCDWNAHAYAWELENPRLVEPVPIKGQLRLFNVDASLINVIHQ